MKFRTGCLIAILILLIGSLATCGVCYCQHESNKPPSLKDATHAFEITKGNILIRVFLSGNFEKVSNQEYYLYEYYESIDDKWHYVDSRERPLHLTEYWGDIKVSRR